MSVTKLRPPRLIGVIHLPSLPGAPGSHGLSPTTALQKAGAQAVREARLLAQAGFEALIVENFGDAPFFKTRVSAETVASMAIIAGALREATRLPVGVNILRNDALSALAVAAVAGCDFIRVNVLSGVAATDQGVIEGHAAELLRERDRLHAHVAIFADAHVKHARSLSSHKLSLAVEELALRSHADAVIITGATTGRAIGPESLLEASEAAREIGTPLFVGSGTTADNVGEILKHADGVIVGSSLRKGGRAGAPLDARRLKAFVRATKSRSSTKR